LLILADEDIVSILAAEPVATGLGSCLLSHEVRVLERSVDG
jgi:hypothetical protein